MNWVVLVAAGWAVLLVAAGLVLGRAMRRRDRRDQQGRHRAPAKPVVPAETAQAPEQAPSAEDRGPEEVAPRSDDDPPTPVPPRESSRHAS